MHSNQQKNETIYRELMATLPYSRSNPDDNIPISILHILCPDGKMNPSVCANIMDFSQKELKVKSVCDLSKLKLRPDDGRFYILIKRKTISSTSYPELINKLFDLFFGIQNITMEEFFETWMKWRREESSASEKTLKENRFLWNALLRDDVLVKQPLKDLTITDYLSYFRRITKNRQLTRKRFNDVKSIMNGMLYLAVEQRILTHNVLRDINYRQFSYKPESNTVQPYTETERLEIINYLDDEDFYSLAIKFDFYMVLRIGELKGLRWDDISGDMIHIQRFVNDKNEIVEDIKGHEEEGKRYQPLIPAAKLLLEKIRKLNPDSEYIFIRNGKPLSTVTFNRRLKKCCEELNIPYRSSHKIRFSTVSIMKKQGMEETELQQLLGHTTLTMTQHYLRNITPADETAQKMNQILG